MRSRLALGLAVVLAGCSGGGSKSNAPPSPPWGNFRQDNANSATAGSINTNTGTVSLLAALPGPVVVDAGVTRSTPTVDLNGNVLVGTTNGIVSFNPDCLDQPTPPAPTPDTRCQLLWRFTGCTLSCTGVLCPPTPVGATPTPVSVGKVSASPSVTAGGTVVFGNDPTDGQPGRVFAVQEPGSGVVCNWMFPAITSQPTPTPPPTGDEAAAFSTTSSAATLINPDLTLGSVFVGGDDGVLRALNADGTVRWSFATDGASPRITSSPAIDLSNNVYATSADGVLSSIDLAGRLLWRVPIGNPGEPLQPSPAVGTTVYAIGAGSALFAVNPNGTQKWQFPTGQPPPVPIVGSPAFVIQNIDVGAQNFTDTIVYAVDAEGTAYGVRDSNGTVFEPQRCLPSEPTVDCRTDSCLPDGGTCTNGKCSISAAACTADTCPSCNRCAVVPGHCLKDPAVECTPDTCPTGAGTCENGKCSIDATCTCTPDSCLPDECVPQEGISVAPPTSSTTPVVGTSLVVSGDLFVVVGTTDGRVCARGLDGSVPGQTLTTPTAAWSSGCIYLDKEDCATQSPPSSCATQSSPSIGENGVIYVTTNTGLYAIR